MTKGYLMNNLIEKMLSPDQDFRYMGLNDLMNEIKTDPNSFAGDEAVENRVINQVLKLVEDKISEVKNQAVKCLGQLIKIIKQHQMETVIDKLIEYSGGTEEELRDISGLALKTICAETPPDSKIATGLCAKLTPKILEQVQKSDTPAESLVESLSVLSILVQRFSPILASNPPIPPPLQVLAPLLTHARPVVRKRAILTISHFTPITPAGIFQNLLTNSILPNLTANSTMDKQKMTVNLVAAVGKQAPMTIAPSVAEIVSLILALVKKDDEELREGCIQALEVLVSRCPTETNTFLDKIVAIGCTYIKWDPNYADDGNGDDDEVMGAPDDEDDDDADDDAGDYSDDEDTSYKIRRAATKLLSAVIATHPELLTMLYKDVSPVLISRFGDREETVRLEIWATYGVLLKQTGLYGGLTPSAISPSTGGKRKRDDSNTDPKEPMDIDSATSIPGSPYAQLKSQLPSLTKSLFSQVKGAKTPPVQLQATFELLRSVLDVMPGSLSGQTSQVVTVSKMILSSSNGSSGASGGGGALVLGCLSFLGIFFATTPTISSSWAPSSEDSSIMDILVKTAKERHPRVAAEAFRVFSSLLNSVKPISAPTPWVDQIYDEALVRLQQHDTDADVRAAAEDVVADLWISAPTLMKSKGGEEWRCICKPTRGEGGVRVVMKVALGVEGGMGEQWVGGVLDWLVALLKDSAGIKGKKGEVFDVIGVVLASYTQGTIPDALPRTLIPILKPYLSTSPPTSTSTSATTDPTLLPTSLSLLALLLTLSPSTTFPLIESDKSLMLSIYALAYSPILSDKAMESMNGFLEALVRADNQIASHLVMNFVGGAVKGGSPVAPAKSAAAASNGIAAGDVSLPNVARCVGIVVRTDQSVAAGVIREYSKYLKKPSKGTNTQLVIVSLLIVGELGRFIDMAPQQDIFNAVISYFSQSPTTTAGTITTPAAIAGSLDEEEIRTAASFAAGNIAIGNLHMFLPAIVKMIKSDERGVRVGGLGGVREVVTHASHGQLESIADQLWVPLFEIDENSGDESTRNVASACLGKLACTQPSKFLPLLHARVRDSKPSTRATVVSAIRYTFTDSSGASKGLDELLAPLIVDFLSLMSDVDLSVRRLAISSLNSAARTKPNLIRDHLSTLLPSLYTETEVKKELIRTVQMGPWTHKVDEGLDNRKTAFETMYTLIDTCLAQLDLSEFLPRIITGLSDDSDEIKVISHMILFRLSTISPISIIPYLDSLVSPLEKTVKGVSVTKDTVKQDLERSAELQRSAVRAVVALSKIGVGVLGGAPATGGGGVSQKFDAFVADVRRNSVWGGEFKELAVTR